MMGIPKTHAFMSAASSPDFGLGAGVVSLGCSQAWLHTQGLYCSTARRASQQSAEWPGWAFLLQSFPSQSCYRPATCSHVEKETRGELQERWEQPAVLAASLRDSAAGGQEGLCPRDSTGGSSLAPGCPSLGAV